MLVKKWIFSGMCAFLVMGGVAFAEEDNQPPREDSGSVELEEEHGDRGGRRGRHGVKGKRGGRDGGKRGGRRGGDGRRGHRPPPFEHILERHDANDDGKLQISEKPERMPEHVFDVLDGNGDGSVTLEEAKEGHEKLRGSREGGRRGPEGRRHHKGNYDNDGDNDDRKGRRGPRGGDRRGGDRPSADEIYDKMDANGDGVVDRAEAKAFREQRQGGHGGVE